jgi:hypothetical protein
MREARTKRWVAARRCQHEAGGALDSSILQGGAFGKPEGTDMADDNNNGHGMFQWGGVQAAA